MDTTPGRWRTISGTGICNRRRGTLRWRKEGSHNSGGTDREAGQAEVAANRLALSPQPDLCAHPIMAMERNLGRFASQHWEITNRCRLIS